MEEVCEAKRKMVAETSMMAVAEAEKAFFLQNIKGRFVELKI